MTQQPLATRAKVRDEKDDRPLPQPIQKQRLTVKKATERKVLTQIVKIRHADSGTLSVCLNYKSEKGCVHGDKCHFRHVEADEKPSKKSKKGGAKGSVALLKESTQLGCVSQDSYPRKHLMSVVFARENSRKIT